MKEDVTRRKKKTLRIYTRVNGMTD